MCPPCQKQVFRTHSAYNMVFMLGVRSARVTCRGFGV